MQEKQVANAMTLSGVTSSQNGPDIPNYEGDGLLAVIDITTLTGSAPTALFTIEGKDPVSGKYFTLLATTALNATATTILQLGRGILAAANVAANVNLPSVLRCRVTTGGTVTNLTATVTFCLTN